jgi:hypothetical protein
VDSTSLLPCFRPDLVQGLPETQSPIAGRELGIEGKAVLVAQPKQELPPALRALAIAALDRQERTPASSHKRSGKTLTRNPTTVRAIMARWCRKRGRQRPADGGRRYPGASGRSGE